MKMEPTLKNYCWLKSIIDQEINMGEKRDEVSLLWWCQCLINSFVLDIGVGQVEEMMNRVLPCLSETKRNDLLEYLFMTIHGIKEDYADMKKVNVIIKSDLFKSIGVEVESCSAYLQDDEKYVRVNGSIIRTDGWDDNYCLRVKANLYNDEDDIIHIDYDYDLKSFIKIGYESFTISCYTYNEEKIKCVEIYPRLQSVKDLENE